MGSSVVDTVLGVDIGGTKTALMLTDADSGHDIARETFATPTGDGPDAFVTTLGEHVRELCARGNIPRGTVRAVGIAVPGQVGRHGFVIEAGNLAGWHRVPLSEIVSRRFGVPVFVEQDANAAALGERWRGVARSMHNFVFVALGTGVGAGVVVNGRLHRGSRQAAGELGDLLLDVEELDRPPGEGGLARLVGGGALRAEARRLAGEGSTFTARAALERGLAGDDVFVAFARRIVDRLAWMVTSVVAVLDPEAIVFGGGTGASELLVDAVATRIAARIDHPPALVVSALREDAQLHGAVFGAMWQLDPDLAIREELR